MAFNWQRFCDEHNISYVTTGPNVGPDHINIKCPFCGDEDPSEHMGLHLKSTLWGCRRNTRHRARRPHRLIMRLLGCSYDVADSYMQGEHELSEFDEMAKRFLSSGNDGEQDKPTVEFPKEFRKLSERGRGKMYFDYIVRERGFRRSDVSILVEDYGLRYCDRGYWRGRIIIPIWFGGQLAGWTGRSVYPKEELRYLSLSSKPNPEHPDLPCALMSVRDLIWNYDDLVSRKWSTVVVTEGPLDAIKVDYYAKKYRVRATCVFGSGLNDHQGLLLADVRDHCKKMVVFPDSGAYVNEFDLLSRLIHLRPESIHLPSGVDDPGDLTRHQIKQIFSPLDTWKKELQ